MRMLLFTTHPYVVLAVGFVLGVSVCLPLLLIACARGGHRGS